MQALADAYGQVASISIQGKAAIVFYAGHLTYEGMHALAESLLDALPSQSYVSHG